MDGPYSVTTVTGPLLPFVHLVPFELTGSTRIKLLPPTILAKVMCSVLSVCLFVCLFVSKITPKVVDGL